MYINIEQILCNIDNIINELFVALLNASNTLFLNLRLNTFINSSFLFLHYIFTFVKECFIYIAILILLDFEY